MAEVIKCPCGHRPGTRLMKELPEGEAVVGMVIFNNKIYVATNRVVYVHRFIPDGGEQFEPLHFLVDGD